jgi:hypothetical protein
VHDAPARFLICDKCGLEQFDLLQPLLQHCRPVIRTPTPLNIPSRFEQGGESIGHVSSYRAPRITVEAIENAVQVSPPGGLACICPLVEFLTQSQ